MAFDLILRYGDAVAASGRLDTAEARLDLALPRLPAAQLTGALEARPVDQPAPGSASASCISEWLRCGDAVLESDRILVPLTFDAGPVLGNLDRPYESTLYLTLGTQLARVNLRIPTLLPAAAAPEPLAPTINPPPTHPHTHAPTHPQHTPALPHTHTPTPGVCRNHPDLPTDRHCGWCRNSFCDQCLVELRGSYLCAWCKQAALAQMQRGVTTVDPKQVVLWARVYDIVMALGAVAMLALQIFSMSLNSNLGLNSTVYQNMPMLYWLGFVPSGIALLVSVPPAIGLGPGRKWAYLWQTIMLIPSMLLSCLWASCLGLAFWPAAIVLLIYWIKPEVKEYCETGQ